MKGLWLKIKNRVSDRLQRRVIFEITRSNIPLREELTHEILRYFSIRTTATIEEVEELYIVIGPNWMKLANATDMLDQGHRFKEVWKLAAMARI